MILIVDPITIPTAESTCGRSRRIISKFATTEGLVFAVGLTRPALRRLRVVVRKAPKFGGELWSNRFLARQHAGDQLHDMPENMPATVLNTAKTTLLQPVGKRKTPR